MRRRLTIAAGLAAILLAACADRTGTGGSAPSPTGPTPSGPTPSGPGPSAPSPTGTVPILPPPVTTQPGTTPPSGPTLVLDGVAEHGVEPGCVVLRAGARQFVLLGAGGKTLARVPMRVPIRVRVAVLTGVTSYCQQGTPVQVLQVSRR